MIGGESDLEGCGRVSEVSEANVVDYLDSLTTIKLESEFDFDLCNASCNELLTNLFDEPLNQNTWQQVPSPSHVLDLNLASPINMFLDAAAFKAVDGKLVVVEDRKGTAVTSDASVGSFVSDNMVKTEKEESSSISSPLGNVECASAGNPMRCRRRQTPPPPYSATHRPCRVASSPFDSMDNACSNEQLLQNTLKDFEALQRVVKTEDTDNLGENSELRRALNDRSFVNQLGVSAVHLEALVANNEANNEGNIANASPMNSRELSEELDQCMEPMLSKAMDEVKDEIDATSILLDISSDPGRWSLSDFFKWLRFSLNEDDSSTMKAMNTSVSVNTFDANRLSKEHIASLIQPFHSSSTVDVIFAQLEVWRNAVHYVSVSKSTLATSERPATPPPPYPSSSASTDDEEETTSTSTPSTATSASTSSSRSRSGSGSASIHLWQFVKELLQQPELYSDCIYWLEREAGVFKIVDSARVATLWGQRKNRPAMNYDKLSRSLRQYYRKGIMRKTERTQRLVYQFCPPYHL